ncbi:MAG: PTS IIA-like nitrogen regulatory protein PtsN [Hyphomicrobiales bacterium]
MQLSDILSDESIVPALKAGSKKQLLQELAQVAAALTELSPREVFEVLLQREKLGSTGLGQGIAIPHGKFEALDGVRGIFARLSNPVEFDAVDGKPVDLVFLLLAPESAGADHLKALARVSRLLREVEVVKKLRGSETSAALYSILTEPAASHAA